MDHQQKQHEKHDHERKEKQAHEREAERNFSKPGMTVHPLWFGVIGLVLTAAALAVWMFLIW